MFPTLSPEERRKDGARGICKTADLFIWGSDSPKRVKPLRMTERMQCRGTYGFIACSTATATATDAPTMGLLPMPINPIISTCAGTEDDPANWASECIRPMVSVMPYEAGPAPMLSG